MEWINRMAWKNNNPKTDKHDANWIFAKNKKKWTISWAEVISFPCMSMTTTTANTSTKKRKREKMKKKMNCFVLQYFFFFSGRIWLWSNLHSGFVFIFIFLLNREREKERTCCCSIVIRCYFRFRQCALNIFVQCVVVLPYTHVFMYIAKSYTHTISYTWVMRLILNFAFSF